MPRKPNYRFERSQRERNKATKKAERLQAQADKVAARKATSGETETQDAAEVAEPHEAGEGSGGEEASASAGS